MSEVDLAALAEAGKDRIESKAPTPMQEVNAALKESGFGLFNIQLLFATFVAYISGVLVTLTTSFLLPSAECDLNMNLIQKGLLNAIPYIGMLFSSVIAGFLTDAFGRKVFITWGSVLSFVFNIVSGSSQTFAVLIASKFFEGLLFACYFTATLTLSSEFCHDGIRDRILIFQSSYASAGQIVVSAMSWGILPHNWKLTLFDGKFVLHTWNFYLFIMSLWVLLAYILFSFIPESPKYLVSQGKYDEARNILIKIYKINTRKSEDTFLYKDLWKEKSDRKLNDISESEENNTFSHHIVVALHNSKPLFQGKRLMFLVLICLINCIIMAVYNTLRLWYPQVSTIVEHNSFEIENGSTQDLCMMLDAYTSKLHMLTHNSNVTRVCVTHKSGAETYINSIIIGCVSCVPHFISGILVSRVGKKPLQLVTSMIAIAATLGLRFASSKAAVVSLFGLAIAITQSTMSLSQVCTLEYLPTNMRSLGISMMMVMGRVGTLTGNILFPVMLKMGCTIPFYTLSGMIMCVVVMTIFLPTKKKT